MWNIYIYIYQRKLQKIKSKWGIPVQQLLHLFLWQHPWELFSKMVYCFVPAINNKKNQIDNKEELCERLQIPHKLHVISRSCNGTRAQKKKIRNRFPNVWIRFLFYIFNFFYSNNGEYALRGWHFPQLLTKQTLDDMDLPLYPRV